jgi:hypothetical protein
MRLYYVPGSRRPRIGARQVNRMASIGAPPAPFGAENETAKTRARMRRGNEWVRAGLFDIVNMPQRRRISPCSGRAANG